MPNKFLSPNLTWSILYLITFSVCEVTSLDETAEFQRKMTEGTVAVGAPTFPPSGLTVKAKAFTTPDDFKGREFKSVFTGNMSEGMVIGLSEGIETRQVFNRSYAFEVTRQFKSSTWKLTRVYDREKGFDDVTSKAHFQMGNRIGYLNWRRIVTDPSFVVDAIAKSIELGQVIKFRFSCDISDRPDFTVHGGTVTVNSKKEWRLENYSVTVTYADGEKATLQGKNSYAENERITSSSFANIVAGVDGKFGRNEVDYLFEVPPDVLQDFGELYYLSDYGLPEPPAKGGSFFSPLKIGVAMALLIVSAFGFWYARRQ